MSRLGIVLDAAHMTVAGVSNATDPSGDPMILSHVIYLDPYMKSKNPRVATPEHAKIVVETGGLLGVWNIGTRVGSIDFAMRPQWTCSLERFKSWRTGTAWNTSALERTWVPRPAGSTATTNWPTWPRSCAVPVSTNKKSPKY
jgi:hypothetical protein